MNLYQLTSEPHGKEQITEFLKDHFVAIGWPGLGDLEGISEQELGSRIAEVYGYQGEQLAELTEHIYLFVHGIEDGDWVVMAHQDTVYLGDIGDYFYDEGMDHADSGLCHKRGVTWLARIPRMKLNETVKAWLSDGAAIARFDHPLEVADLEQWVRPMQQEETAVNRQASVPRKVEVDQETIEEALAILKRALRSADPDRQERAAVAILQFARG